METVNPKWKVRRLSAAVSSVSYTTGSVRRIFTVRERVRRVRPLKLIRSWVAA
jgi:hypothetical protein